MSVRKTTARKTTASRKTSNPKTPSPSAARKRSTAAKKAPVPAAPLAKSTQQKPLMKKRELVERAVERSGVKKSDARQVTEAVLAEIGEALAEGRELSVPPLGRVMINREKPIPGGRVVIVKVRQKNLSEAEEVTQGVAAKTAAE